MSRTLTKILLLVAIMSLVCCDKDPETMSYKELREILEVADGSTTLVVFFDPEAKSTTKTDMIDEINKQIFSEDEFADYGFAQSGMVVDNILNEEDR